jgi:hypothetical protein
MLLHAVAYCCAVRLALWVVPSRVLLRYVRDRVERVGEGTGSGSPTAEEIAWTVRAAGRRIPRSTCLVEALSVQLLLAMRGYRSELRIGVARDDRQNFTAHAWVEVGGRVLVGARRGMRYAPLPDLGHTLG